VATVIILITDMGMDTGIIRVTEEVTDTIDKKIPGQIGRGFFFNYRF
jgi:hypothetical protein